LPFSDPFFVSASGHFLESKASALVLPIQG
jgi:hypothetical protein